MILPSSVLVLGGQHVAGYVPVDISGDYLRKVAGELQADYPDVPVHPVVADFTQPFPLPATPKSARRNILYFPGSSGFTTRGPASVYCVQPSSDRNQYNGLSNFSHSYSLSECS